MRKEAKRMLPDDLAIDLGSPVKYVRSNAVRVCIDEGLLNPEELLGLSATNNIFLLISLIHLALELGSTQYIARYLSAWFSYGTAFLGPVPNPAFNQDYWYRPSELFKQRTSVVGHGVLLRELGEGVANHDVAAEFVAGIGDLGRWLAATRKDLMAAWHEGEHYVWSNQSFSPLLFVRAVLSSGENWWDHARQIRIDQSKQDVHGLVPVLTNAELDQSVPFAWEEERLLLGYFLPIYPEIQAYRWILDVVLPQVWWAVTRNGGHTPALGSLQEAEQALSYRSLPGQSVSPYLSYLIQSLAGIGVQQ